MTGQFDGDDRRSQPAYRAYEIGDDGRIRTSTDILADSDEDAIIQVRQMAEDRPFELWDRGRLILRLPSLDD